MQLHASRISTHTCCRGCRWLFLQRRSGAGAAVLGGAAVPGSPAVLGGAAPSGSRNRAWQSIKCKKSCQSVEDATTVDSSASSMYAGDRPAPGLQMVTASKHLE